MCGLPYVWRSARSASSLELLAAPVMAGPRYADQPRYFSDIVVRHDRPWSSFADLEGVSWAYNEETSHSGYNVIRHRLAQLGRQRGFFGMVRAAGSHEASVRMLLGGEVDASAIDSTVLDLLLRQDPSLSSRLRTVEVLGPSPMPPWVIRGDVPEDLRRVVRGALLSMSDDPRGRAVLDRGLMARFALVADADYDPVRRMAEEAAPVEL